MARPGPNNQGKPEIANLGEKVHHGISGALQEALIHARRQHNANIGDAAYVASMGTLAAATIASLSFVIKPDLTREEALEEGEDLIRKLVTPEGIQFACLVTALMQVDYNATNGQFVTEFGPPMFWEALKMWELLNPGKDVDKYFDATMLAVARQAGENSVVPFTDFLAKRAQAQHTPSSKTLN